MRNDNKTTDLYYFSYFGREKFIFIAFFVKIFKNLSTGTLVYKDFFLN